jgi:hypothetical protein
MSRSTAVYRAQWVFVGKSSVTFSRAIVISIVILICSAAQRFIGASEGNISEELLLFRLMPARTGYRNN